MTSWLAGFAAPVGQADCFACYSCAAGTTRHVRGEGCLRYRTRFGTARDKTSEARGAVPAAWEIAQRQKTEGTMYTTMATTGER